MSVRKLPVLKTAIEGWWLLAKDWSVLLRIAWLPLGVVVALDFLIIELWKGRLWGLPDRMDVLMDMDVALAIVLGGLIVALWHRVQLTGSRVLSILGLLAAWRNIAALTAQWCGLALVTIGLTWVFSLPLGLPAEKSLNRILAEMYGLVDYPVLYRVLMDLILHGGPLLITLYVSGRLGLMLWARPAGGEDALDRAWAAGNGNGWRIAAAIFVAITPVMIFLSALQATLGEAGYFFEFYVWSDLSNLLQLVVGVSVISAAHQTLLGGEDAADAMAST